MEIRCSLCSAASHLNFNIKGYVQHIKLFHAHCANFRVTCGIGGCQRCYSNVRSFLNHVYAVHKDDSNAQMSCHMTPLNHHDDSDQDDIENFDSDTLDDDNEIDRENHPSYPPNALQNSSATFLLGLKELYKLTQVSLDGVVQGVTALNQQNLAILKEEVGINVYFCGY